MCDEMKLMKFFLFSEVCFSKFGDDWEKIVKFKKHLKMFFQLCWFQYLAR